MRNIVYKYVHLILFLPVYCEIVLKMTWHWIKHSHCVWFGKALDVGLSVFLFFWKKISFRRFVFVLFINMQKKVEKVYSMLLHVHGSERHFTHNGGWIINHERITSIQAYNHIMQGSKPYNHAKLNHSSYESFKWQSKPSKSKRIKF